MRAQGRLWLPLVAIVALLTAGLLAAHAPTPTLFAGLLAGIALALSGRASGGRSPLVVHPALVHLSQAAIGVTVGSYVRPQTLSGVASHAAPILGTCIATLAVSVLTGLLLARRSDVDRPTGAFCMIAGGASGLTAVSRELGADERLVVVVQYLRVVLVVTTTPLIARLVFAPGGDSGVAHVVPAAVVPSLAVLLVCTAVGLLLNALVPLPAGALLGPLTASAATALLGASYGGIVALLAQSVAFAVVGAQIGLRFTPATLRVARNVLPAALALIVAVMAACYGFGVLLAAMTHKPALDGYLATTPGGLYVVLATAASTRADLTFVVAVQVLRLVVMLVSAPLLAKLLRQTSTATRGAAEGTTA